MATDQDTRDYVARRQAQGKTKSEAIRCHKRCIAREVVYQFAGGSLAGKESRPHSSTIQS